MLCRMFQHKCGTCTSEITYFDAKKACKLEKISNQLCYNNPFLELYLSPSRCDRMQNYIILQHYAVKYLRILTLIKNKKHNYFIHATLVYVYNPASIQACYCYCVLVRLSRRGYTKKVVHVLFMLKYVRIRVFVQRFK